MLRQTSLFQSDLDFCPDCGTVLPLPGVEDMVACRRCDYRVDVKAFHGVEIKSAIFLNEPTKIIQNDVNDTNQRKHVGPKVDRKCLQCGHEQMTYTTQQTRSADEGQTVFYTCLECRFQEIEFS
ncbi:DNA-directed RNA polymerase I subunit RPA12-like [Pomacea canaliculata]|uniref:DNA-directed RNA polymerase I subunit RPA12-like n=1 Tax=Pomacea canaliculata TaxID=400727 RepID=UPI000D72723F|nr:DNA-directed RNA polymerase I subunit RPA12-like [Pomacea canaliculata]